MRVVHEGIKFKVLKTYRDFIVVKSNNAFYNEHSHFNKYYSAVKFVKLMDKCILPKGKYFTAAARRLLTEQEFNKLKTGGKIGSKGYINKR